MKRAPFVLVEVIIAFLIIVEVLVLLFSVQKSALQTLQQARNSYEVAIVGEQALVFLIEKLHKNEIDLTAAPKKKKSKKNLPLTPMNLSFHPQGVSPGWSVSFSYQIKKTAEGEPPPNFLIDIAITTEKNEPTPKVEQSKIYTFFIKR
jgi:hypothetical protein